MTKNIKKSRTLRVKNLKTRRVLDTSLRYFFFAWKAGYVTLVAREIRVRDLRLSPKSVKKYRSLIAKHVKTYKKPRTLKIPNAKPLI